MARPRKLTRDPAKQARTLNEIQATYNVAQAMYRATGGESIDTQISALDRTQRDYQSQCDSCDQHGKDVGAWGPTVSRYESRMTAGVAARLHKQREDKMAQCLLWAEEGAEAREVASAACPEPAEGSSPMAAVPETEPAAPTSAETAPEKQAYAPVADERIEALLGAVSTAAIGGTPMPLGQQPHMNRKERRAAERAARRARS